LRDRGDALDCFRLDEEVAIGFKSFGGYARKKTPVIRNWRLNFTGHLAATSAATLRRLDRFCVVQLAVSKGDLQVRADLQICDTGQRGARVCDRFASTDCLEHKVGTQGEDTTGIATLRSVQFRYRVRDGSIRSFELPIPARSAGRPQCHVRSHLPGRAQM
jgi:hypothetical protein